MERQLLQIGVTFLAVGGISSISPGSAVQSAVVSAALCYSEIAHLRICMLK